MKKPFCLLAVLSFLAIPLLVSATLAPIGSGKLEIDWSGPNVMGYYGDYDGRVVSSDFGYTTGWEEIFCVSSETALSLEVVAFYAIDPDLGLELGSKYQQAAWIADNWTTWGTSDEIKVEAQKAIWKIMDVMDKVETDGTDWILYNLAIEKESYVTDNWYFANSEDHQDYLTPTNSIPEPATMLLLGAGLIGIAGVGRKRFLKKP